MTELHWSAQEAWEKVEASAIAAEEAEEKGDHASHIKAWYAYVDTDMYTWARCMHCGCVMTDKYFESTKKGLCEYCEDYDNTPHLRGCHCSDCEDI